MCDVRFQLRLDSKNEPGKIEGRLLSPGVLLCLASVSPS